MDIPRIFTLRESNHRIHNPFTAEQLDTLGAALRLDPGTSILDLGSGSGEMLCTWARDHDVTGIGVDLSAAFTANAQARAAELGLGDRVTFVHNDAAGFVTDEPVDVGACLGATWVGGGVAGTIELLNRSVRDGGLLLIGEPYWRRLPTDDATIEACGAQSIGDFLELPALLEQFSDLGCDVVEMILATQAGWDRYMAAQWLTLRRWLDENGSDEMAGEVRDVLATEPATYARTTREYVGWGVFALMMR